MLTEPPTVRLSATAHAMRKPAHHCTWSAGTPAAASCRQVPSPASTRQAPSAVRSKMLLTLRVLLGAPDEVPCARRSVANACQCRPYAPCYESLCFCRAHAGIASAGAAQHACSSSSSDFAICKCLHAFCQQY